MSIARTLNFAAALTAGFVAGFCTSSAPRAIDFKQSDAFSVNRINKGDRLMSDLKGRTHTTLPPAAAALTRPPTGCDPVVSLLNNARQPQIYRRCMA